MDSTAPTATSAPLPPRADLLADAHCLHCGYSLRGLPENRCPECGTAFDPAEFAKIGPARWPILLTWYLAASMAFPLWRVVDRPFGHPSRHQPGWPWEYLGLVPGSRANAATTLTVLLGVVAIMGLWRRRDWGRKAAIAMLASPVVVSLCDFGYRQMLPSIGLPPMPDLLFCIFGLVSEVVPVLILVGVLSTGLRRRTLIRRGHPASALPLLRRFQQGQDWPLVMVTLLTVITIGHVSFLVNCGGAALDLSANWLTRIRWTAATLEQAVIAGGCLLTLMKTWRKPASARAALGSLAWLLVGIYLLRILLDSIILPWIIRGQLSVSFLRLSLRCLWVFVGVLLECVLPLAALWLFARRLRIEDIPRAAPAGSDVKGIG